MTTQSVSLEPTDESVTALLRRDISGPVTMLNLLRLRDWADYSASPEIAPPCPLTGAEAYDRYIRHTLPFLTASGGSITFLPTGGHSLVGPPGERWDLAMAVTQASVQDFLAFASDEAYLAEVGHSAAAGRRRAADPAGRPSASRIVCCSRGQRRRHATAWRCARSVTATSVPDLPKARQEPEQEADMTITPGTLIRSAGIAAVGAGAIFIGVQLNHPVLTVPGVNTTEWAVRSSLKALMATLALVGITGMYLYQVKKMGVLGLVGYLLFAVNYLLIFGSSFVAASVLPSIDTTSPSFVKDALAAASGGHASGDIGLLGNALLLDAALYLAGGLIFGIALYRAGVLTRWAAVLLAVGGAVSAGLSVMPDPWFRLLAFPNGIAMIALGYSLWRITGTQTTETTVRPESVTLSAAAAVPRVAPAGSQ